MILILWCRAGEGAVGILKIRVGNLPTKRTTIHPYQDTAASHDKNSMPC